MAHAIPRLASLLSVIPNCTQSSEDATSQIRARAGGLRGPQAIQARLQSPANSPHPAATLPPPRALWCAAAQRRLQATVNVLAPYPFAATSMLRPAAAHRTAPDGFRTLGGTARVAHCGHIQSGCIMQRASCGHFGEDAPPIGWRFALTPRSAHSALSTGGQPAGGVAFPTIPAHSSRSFCRVLPRLAASCRVSLRPSGCLLRQGANASVQ